MWWALSFSAQFIHGHCFADNPAGWSRTPGVLIGFHCGKLCLQVLTSTVVVQLCMAISIMFCVCIHSTAPTDEQHMLPGQSK